MNTTELGKIARIDIGFGGYDDACFGLRVSLAGKGWGVGDFIGPWAMKPTAYCKWTVEDQSRQFDEAMRRALELCREAQVQTVAALVGTPIEATFEGSGMAKLVSWRVLTEVL